MNAKRAAIVGCVLIAAVAAARVSATRRTFSATNDEPMHIACGLDWLRGRPYVSYPDNPPLARIVAALPAGISGVPAPAFSEGIVDRGNAILYSGGYVRNLGNARLGNLLFLGIAVIAVGALGMRRFGAAAGVVVAALFACLPPIRGHAGLATTDMAGAAVFSLALLLLDRWWDSPTPARAAALGAALGTGALSKFSFLMFFPIAAIFLVARNPKRNCRAARRGVFLPLSMAMAIVWAGYRFEVRTLADAHPATPYLVSELLPPSLQSPAMWAARHVPTPAPLFVIGGAVLMVDNQHGHEAYLLGRTSRTGWWYYFPVALFYKTPLSFLVLAGFGLAVIIRHDRRSLDMALIPPAMLAAVLPASIDIGVRHVLPIYGLLAIVAGRAAVTMSRMPVGRAAAAGLILATIIGCERAHPDYLAWFNAAAGRHPERILADSNLDWGQDYLRLTRILNERHIHAVSILYFGTLRLQEHLEDRGVGGKAIEPWKRGPGWYALSETPLAMNPEARAGAYRWLEAHRYERIGKSIRLYHVPL